MKVILISPPSRVINHYRPPLALMYLSGYLKRNGVDSKIIDITLKYQVRNKDFFNKKPEILADVENEILKRVEKEETDIIGITCYTPELQEVIHIANKIKTVKPDIKIVAGGIHPTLYPGDFLGQPTNFDFVVMGEGEVSLLELIKTIRNGNMDYSRVKGIGYYDNSSSRPVITAPQPLVENLDEITFPDYEDLDMDFYTTPSPYAIRGVYTKSFYILSSRGCPSSCTFCVAKKLRDYHGIKKFVRLRSPLSLFSEVMTLKEKYGIDSFYFIDDLFTLRKSFVHEFCNLLIKNRSRLIWGCSSKVNTVDFNTLKDMKKAGCVQIDFGVERGSDEALKYLKKGITVSEIKKTFEYCDKLGIRTFANMLVNIPGETEKDLQDIIELVTRIRPTITQFNLFTPYPGCEIYNLFCKELQQKDYPLLMEDPGYLISQWPEKFRFAGHMVDFSEWVSKATKRYNKILPNLSIYLTPRYISNLVFSRNTFHYLKETKSLVREFIYQKF